MGMTTEDEQKIAAAARAAFQPELGRQYQEEHAREVWLAVARAVIKAVRACVVASDDGGAMSKARDLEDAREAYFSVGGIESDIGPRDDPQWYWRRAYKIVSAQRDMARRVLSALTTCKRCEAVLHLPDAAPHCEDGCKEDKEEAVDKRERVYDRVIGAWEKQSGMRP